MLSERTIIIPRTESPFLKCMCVSLLSVLFFGCVSYMRNQMCKWQKRNVLTISINPNAILEFSHIESIWIYNFSYCSPCSCLSFYTRNFMRSQNFTSHKKWHPENYYALHLWHQPKYKTTFFFSHTKSRIKTKFEQTTELY